MDVDSNMHAEADVGGGDAVARVRSELARLEAECARSNRRLAQLRSERSRQERREARVAEDRQTHAPTVASVVAVPAAAAASGSGTAAAARSRDPEADDGGEEGAMMDGAADSASSAAATELVPPASAANDDMQPQSKLARAPPTTPKRSVDRMKMDDGADATAAVSADPNVDKTDDAEMRTQQEESKEPVQSASASADSAAAGASTAAAAATAPAASAAATGPGGRPRPASLLGRERRMFGVLLGTLRSASSRLAAEQASGVAAKQAARERHVAERIAAQAEGFRDHVALRREEELRWARERVEQEEAHATRMEKRQHVLQLDLLALQAAEHARHLSNFLLTDLEPRLAWLPAQHTVDTQARMSQRSLECLARAEELEDRPQSLLGRDPATEVWTPADAKAEAAYEAFIARDADAQLERRERQAQPRVRDDERANALHSPERERQQHHDSGAAGGRVQIRLRRPAHGDALPPAAPRPSMHADAFANHPRIRGPPPPFDRPGPLPRRRSRSPERSARGPPPRASSRSRSRERDRERDRRSGGGSGRRPSNRSRSRSHSRSSRARRSRSPSRTRRHRRSRSRSPSHSRRRRSSPSPRRSRSRSRSRSPAASPADEEGELHDDDDRGEELDAFGRRRRRRGSSDSEDY